MMYINWCVAGAALAMGSPAAADFMGLAIDARFELPGTLTFDISVQFSNPDDQLIGVIGTEEWPLLITSALPLANDPDSFTAGTHLDDVPVPWAADWDTWVTLGDESPFQILFSDGFADGSGSESVLQGCRIEEIDGGWLDGDLETAEDGGQVLIARLTVPFNSDWRLKANAVWRPGGTGDPEITAFDLVLDYPESCREDLDLDGEVGLADLIDLLEAWGACADTCCTADITGDEVIGFADLQLLLDAWGPC